MREKIVSWMPNKFWKGRTIYRCNKPDAIILAKNIGKKVDVLVMPGRNLITIEPEEFIKKDTRSEWDIPENEKGWSKKFGRNVPNRYHFKIKPMEA